MNQSLGDDIMAAGTVAGTILLYSAKLGNLVTVLSKPTSQRINVVTSDLAEIV